MTMSVTTPVPIKTEPDIVVTIRRVDGKWVSTFEGSDLLPSHFEHMIKYLRFDYQTYGMELTRRYQTRRREEIVLQNQEREVVTSASNITKETTNASK